MTFPTTAIATTNLDASSDDPSLARADLLQAVQTINTILSTANGAYGVLVLQGDATINPNKLPGTLAPTGQLTLNPSNTIVKVQNILRLQQVPKAVMLAQTNMVAGDIMLASDADSGNPAVCFYTGTEWKFMPASAWTTLA